MISGDLLNTITWMFFALAMIVFAIVSIVLNYHWREYGLEKLEHIGRVRVTYFGVAGALILCALISGLIGLS